MYKKIMLSLLLLPYMVVGSNDNDYQIKQLKNMQRDKEEDIAFIIEQIDEKENLIDSIFLKAQNVFPNIDSNEKENLYEAMNLLEFSLKQALIKGGSIQDVFYYDFINHNKKYEFEFKRMKYIVIRYVLEYMNLYKLIQQYEKCLQGLLEISNQLENLQILTIS